MKTKKSSPRVRHVTPSNWVVVLLVAVILISGVWYMLEESGKDMFRMHKTVGYLVK